MQLVTLPVRSHHDYTAKFCTYAAGAYSCCWYEVKLLPLQMMQFEMVCA